jgi:GABA(A) receptor-associated protein
MSSYRKNNSVETRISECNKILSKYPDKIPVIVESDDKEISNQLKKFKFLVPGDVSVSHLICKIREQLKLNKSKGIFLFCDNSILSSYQMVQEIYEDYKTRNGLNSRYDDKFLYITVSAENTFG